MNTRFLFLFVILTISILVFVWGTANYLRCYTDTPSGNYYDVCPPNVDPYAIPAVIATFVMIGIVPVITWMKTGNCRFGIIFTVLSGVGIFLTFVGVLNLILMIRA